MYLRLCLCLRRTCEPASYISRLHANSHMPRLQLYISGILNSNIPTSEIRNESCSLYKHRSFFERYLGFASLEPALWDFPCEFFPSQEPFFFSFKALPCLLCGTFRDFLHETNFWMSSGGTRSVIHYDADHNLHCIVTGRKDFMMIDQKFSDDFKLTKVRQTYCWFFGIHYNFCSFLLP